MKSISDQALRDIVVYLSSYAEDMHTTENLRDYNKKRRARLLARQLEKKL